MSIIPHPSSFISTTILSEIRRYAADAEAKAMLHDRQLATIYEQRWFKMFVPKEMDGLEITLPDVLKIEEALAWADGSTAWVVTLCSGAGWFYGFIDPEHSKTVFANNQVCLAGSGAPSGTAEMVDNGFRINGTWKYASGALHATMFTANCVITKTGVALTNSDGSPVIRAFLVDKKDVVLEKNWTTMGMSATASHGFVIKDLLVDVSHSFQITPHHTTHHGLVYKYPFLQLAETTLAVNYSGMTVRFLDLCEPIFRQRMNNSPNVTKDLIKIHTEAKEKVQACRDRFYKSVLLSWKALESDTQMKDEHYLNVSGVSHELYRLCLSVMSELHPYTGLAGANALLELNRVWRNFHTASQHTLFSMR
jgi:indole-3-acetate monooxygenase